MLPEGLYNVMDLLQVLTLQDPIIPLHRAVMAISLWLNLTLAADSLASLANARDL